MDIQTKDGILLRGIPDGTPEEVIKARLAEIRGESSKDAPKAEPKETGFFDDMSIKNVPQNLANLAAGAVRGAGSIGATALLPADMINQKLRGDDFFSLKDNNQRRAGIDEGLRQMGANPDSGLYGFGKLAGEIAGTAGAGDALAIGATAAKMPRLAAALKSGGFNLGSKNGGAIERMAIRTAGGAGAGGAQAAMVDPEQAKTGVVVGGVLPAGATVAGGTGKYINQKASNLAKSLMQSAIKPTQAQMKTGEAERAIATLLQEGINPTAAGVNKLKNNISTINDDIASRIENSTAMIGKDDVLKGLDEVKQTFSNQVSPTGDLNAIQSIADDFTSHPSIVGNRIPVQQAQALKQGTYKVLKGKYGEAGSAATEAQKSLARALKEGIAENVPEVGALNARESDLLNALTVAERRALADANKNQLGLAALANNPVGFAAFMADRSPAFKAVVARMVNQSAIKTGGSADAIKQLLEDPVTRAAIINSSRD